MIEVKTPVQQFFDTDGSALDAGYIYIGSSGSNPETAPQAVYWDKNGLIPAAQPIRTLNGYPSRDGAVSRFFTANGNWSITVKNKKGELVYSSLNTDSGVFDQLASSSGAGSVGYDNASSGLSATTVQASIDELKSDADALSSTVSGLELTTSGVVNLFANSAFMINQRGYVSGTATTGANQYTLDRIRVVTSGQSLTFTASTFGNKITAPAGGAEQVVEGNRISGGDYACTWIGSGTIQVNGVTKAKNETFTLTAGSNCTIRMFGEFEQFMLTRPNMVGQYEYNYAIDLLICQRYFERGSATITAYTLSGNLLNYRSSFKQTKRATPTVSISSATYTNTTSASASATETDGLFQATATASAPCAFSFNWSASAEL